MGKARFFWGILLLQALFACESGPWPEKERELFLDECAEEGGKRSYCSCYLEKVMERYPNHSDAEKMDFETAVELAAECE